LSHHGAVAGAYANKPCIQSYGLILSNAGVTEDSIAIVREKQGIPITTKSIFDRITFFAVHCPLREKMQTKKEAMLSIIAKM
jgi:hypothetical protein